MSKVNDYVITKSINDDEIYSEINLNEGIFIQYTTNKKKAESEAKNEQ